MRDFVFVAFIFALAPLARGSPRLFGAPLAAAPSQTRGASPGAQGSPRMQQTAARKRALFFDTFMNKRGAAALRSAACWFNRFALETTDYAHRRDFLLH